MVIFFLIVFRYEVTINPLEIKKRKVIKLANKIEIVCTYIRRGVLRLIHLKQQHLFQHPMHVLKCFLYVLILLWVTGIYPFLIYLVLSLLKCNRILKLRKF